MLARSPLTVGPPPHLVAGLGGDDQFIAVADEILHQDAPDIFLGGAGRRPVVVSQIKMGDAAIKGTAHDLAGFLKIINAPEIVPETQGNGGQQQA